MKATLTFVLLVLTHDRRPRGCRPRTIILRNRLNTALNIGHIMCHSKGSDPQVAESLSTMHF